MTVDFNHVSATVTKRIFAKFGSHVDKDDALQEALIRAWKDVESGEYEYNHIVNRAEMWARKYLFPGTHSQKSTGSSRVDTTGYVRKPEIREKIRLFQSEHIRLHGKKPTQRFMAKSLGMNQSSMSYYLKKMAEDGTKVLRKEGDENRIDFGAYSLVSTDEFFSDAEGEQDNTKLNKVKQDSFEERLIADLRFQEIMRDFEPQARRALILFYECDWTHTDIGWHLWPDSASWTAARTKAQRLLKKCKAQLEVELQR